MGSRFHGTAARRRSSRIASSTLATSRGSEVGMNLVVDSERTHLHKRTELPGLPGGRSDAPGGVRRSYRREIETLSRRPATFLVPAPPTFSIRLLGSLCVHRSRRPFESALSGSNRASGGTGPRGVSECVQMSPGVLDGGNPAATSLAQAALSGVRLDANLVGRTTPALVLPFEQVRIDRKCVVEVAPGNLLPVSSRLGRDVPPGDDVQFIRV